MDSFFFLIFFLFSLFLKRPDLLRASKDLEKECCTGKARIGQSFDRHGRPMLLLDAAAENTKDATAQIKHLTWQMMRLSRKMKQSPNQNIEKNLVFVNLERFSLWSAPSMVKRTYFQMIPRY